MSCLPIRTQATLAACLKAIRFSRSIVVSANSARANRHLLVSQLVHYLHHPLHREIAVDGDRNHAGKILLVHRAQEKIVVVLVVRDHI